MGSFKSVVSEGRFEDLIMILRLALIFCLGTANLVQGAISGSPITDNEKKGFTDSMNDFTQDFLAVAWDDLGENFVFSPFSLHSVLAMLTSGATNNSETQTELLDGFGRNSKIKLLEKLYGQFVKDYKTPKLEKTLKFGNRMWTTPRYYSKVLPSYKKTISKFYNATFSKLPVKNGEVEVNDWVSKITKGKITNLDGKREPIRMMRRESKKQAAGRFETELVKGRSNKCITLAIPYEADEEFGNEGRFEMLII